VVFVDTRLKRLVILMIQLLKQFFAFETFEKSLVFASQKEQICFLLSLVVLNACF